MKFGDKVEFGSHDDIKVNLQAIQSKLNQLGLTIAPLNGDDYLGFAINRIVIFTGELVSKLNLHLDSSIELLAWTARNLFECHLLSTFILKDQQYAKTFLTQKAVDELEINEGFLRLCAENTSSLVTRPIRERNDHIRTTLKKHGLKEAGHWTVGMLAKETNNEDEYKAFFKLYSKYVHPSSWLINGEETEYNTETLRNIFLLQAQYYASCVLRTGEDYKIKVTSMK